MLECQISPYGGNVVWQKLGLQEYPETKWLILLANKDEGNNADYVEQAKNLKNELEDNQKEFPDNFKKTINVIDISDVASDYVKMFQFTLKLFDLIIT